jgi:hypothetical protein
VAITLDGTTGIELVDVTGASDIASGTTAERPASPTTGAIRFNTDLDATEVYDGTSWEPIASGFTFTATIEGSDGTTDWTGSDPYTATVTVSGLLTTDQPVMDIDMSSVSFADVADVQADWALVYRAEVSAADTLKLYATAEPVSSFDVILKVTR